MPVVPWHTQILADQLTLFQPGGTDYAPLITTGTPGFSDLPTALPLGFRRNLGFFFVFITDLKVGENRAEPTRCTRLISDR